METDEFKWDEDKARANLAKHGVSFERATMVFDDPMLLDDADLDHDDNEARSKALGIGDGKLMVVIYTERGPRRRIISARYADKQEHDDYYRQA